MKLISIGFGNAVAAGRILAVVSPDSAPIKRVVQEARERGMLLDASFGRRTKSVLLMDTDHVILSSVTPETIAARMEEKNAEDMVKKFELFGTDPKSLYMLDNEMAGRAYSAPSLVL